MSVKYIDIDSTYRNRVMYPNPSDFVVPISFEQNPVTNPYYAQDPIVNAVPFASSTLQAGSTFTDIVLNATASSIDNFYVDDILEIAGVYLVITSYNGTSKTATVMSPGFGGPPGAGTAYRLRKGIPFYSGTVAAGSTAFAVVLAAGASSVNDFYKGKYIYFLDGTCAGIIAFVVSYTGATRTAIIAKGLAAIPAAGNLFEIDEFTRDNLVPLLYSGSQGFNQSICYTMDLLYVTIPNTLTISGYGSTLDKYPYLYLHIYNEGSVMRSDSVLYSNNINAKGATFKIPLGLNLRQETFFTLKDAKMIQTTKFKPDLPIRFKVTLPNGEPITFATPDNFSPLEPNPLIQISATFAIRRMDGN